MSVYVNGSFEFVEKDIAKNISIIGGEHLSEAQKANLISEFIRRKIENDCSSMNTSELVEVCNCEKKTCSGALFICPHDDPRHYQPDGCPKCLYQRIAINTRVITF